MRLNVNQAVEKSYLCANQKIVHGQAKMREYLSKQELKIAFVV